MGGWFCSGFCNAFFFDLELSFLLEWKYFWGEGRGLIPGCSLFLNMFVDIVDIICFAFMSFCISFSIFVGLCFELFGKVVGC